MPLVLRTIKSETTEVIQALKESGLGTPATRAAIIEGLKKRNLIYISKNSLT